jgi:DNA repair protein RecO (recombination protein O)
MKSESTSAIVLRRTDYGEADRIVVLSTPLGKRTVLARGVRKPRSKLAGGIELLCQSEVVLRHGKGQIATLTQARMQQFFRSIMADYDRLQFMYDVLRLVSRAIESVDEPEWHEVLLEVLQGLNDETVRLALVKTWFYVRYAALLGEELSLWRDVDGQKIIETQGYRYDIEQKGLRASRQGEINASHIKILRVLSQKSLRVAKQVGGVQEYLAVCSNIAYRHASVD